MSQKNLQIFLWLNLLAVLPVPYFLVEFGWIPPIWMLVVGGVLLGIVLFEGAVGTWLFAMLLGIQLVLYAGLMWWGTARASRGFLSDLSPRTRLWVAVAVFLLAVCAANLPIYRSDLFLVGPEQRWLDLF